MLVENYTVPKKIECLRHTTKGGSCKQCAEKYELTKSICMDHRNEIEAPDPVVKDLINGKIMKR